MRGDGGKFGQLGLANGEPREGSALPRLRPRRRPQRECVGRAQCARRSGPSAPGAAARELPPSPAAASASSAAAEPGARELRGPPDQRGRLAPPHAGPAAAVARREGGGSNPAPSSRAPSWTIMIPSKRTTTCSPKRTGTGICSWTRPGRSSRERSAAVAAPSPDPLLPPRSRLGFRMGSGRAWAGAGTRGRGEPGVGLQARGRRGSAPVPEPAHRDLERGEVAPRAGRSPRGPRSRPPRGGREHPRVGRARGRCCGGWGCDPGRWLLARIDFPSLPFPSPPPGRLHMACGGSALPGPPWSRYLRSQAPGTQCAPTPARGRALEGWAAASGSV